MIDSPALKYGSKNWECPTPRHTYDCAPIEDENDFLCNDWRRYSADPDIDLAVIIAAGTKNGLVNSGEEKPITRKRTKK